MSITLPPGSKNLEPGGPGVPSTVVAILRALADPVRIEMIRRLRAAGDDQRCGALYEDLPKTTASHHFRVLRESGVIEQYDRNGRRFNRLQEREIQRLVPGLLEAVFANCASVR